MPNYNHAPFLKERLDSIFAQDYPNKEVIILDDASHDDSVSILRQYARLPEVKSLIINEKNSGNTFCQWQRGMELATGDYIWIAESDDVAETTLLSSLVKALETNHAQLAFARSRFIDENGRDLPRKVDPVFRRSFAMNGKDFVANYMLGENTICNASAVLFRREASLRVDMHQVEQFPASGDRFFWISIALQGNIAFVAEDLNSFRQHGNKVSIKAAQDGRNFVQDHHIYRLISPRLSLSRRQQQKICGYQWQVIHLPWISDEGKKQAIEEWGKERYFTKWSWLIYKTNRIIPRLQSILCSI